MTNFIKDWMMYVGFGLFVSGLVTAIVSIKESTNTVKDCFIVLAILSIVYGSCIAIAKQFDYKPKQP